MTEQKGEYITQQEVNDAMEMLGKGYESPTVSIEPPKKTMQRHGRKMVEVEEPAYVKFSTDFKAELADLDVYALKVFIYIGLSIGYETGTAWPGVRKIAKETKMDKDTVGKAIEELEGKGFLSVLRKEGKSNIYRPNCYFAIGEGVPCGRTVDEEPSDGLAELSHENAKLSDAVEGKMHNKNNKRELDILDAEIHYHLKPSSIKEAFARYFKLTPNWEAKYNRQYLEWLVENNATPEQVEHAAELWRKDRRFNWSAPDLKKVQEHWLELIEGMTSAVKRAMPEFDEDGRIIHA